VNAIPSSGTLNYDANDRTATDTYDNDGNTIAQAGVANIYDFENHLVQHGAVTIVYDGDGNRASETAGGITTKYLVDTQNPTGYAQVVDELQSGAVARTYTWGLTLLSKLEVGSSQRSFYGFDGHGSVRSLTNSTGTVTDSYDYDAFGNLITSTGSTANNYLFAGEQFDPNLGLYYNRTRYLNTSSGTFLTSDTANPTLYLPGTLNRYIFASADPIDNTDPSGETPLSDFVSRLNRYLDQTGDRVLRYTSGTFGQVAHKAIEDDIRWKNPEHIVRTEVPVSTGIVDLIVDTGIYEIKPVGGVVNPDDQLTRYLDSNELIRGFARGTIPFDDTVYSNSDPALGPVNTLPWFVQLHYYLSEPGVILYEPSFDNKRLVRVLAAVTIATLVRLALEADEAEEEETGLDMAIAF